MVCLKPLKKQLRFEITALDRSVLPTGTNGKSHHEPTYTHLAFVTTAYNDFACTAKKHASHFSTPSLPTTASIIHNLVHEALKWIRNFYPLGLAKIKAKNSPAPQSVLQFSYIIGDALTHGRRTGAFSPLYFLLYTFTIYWTASSTVPHTDCCLLETTEDKFFHSCSVIRYNFQTLSLHHYSASQSSMLTRHLFVNSKYSDIHTYSTLSI